MRHLAAVEAVMQTSRQTHDFAQVCKFLMLAQGDHQQAAALAAEAGRPKVQEIFQRAAVDPGSGTLSTWGDELQTFRLAANGFAQSLQSIGVFDAMLAAGVRRVPIATTAGAVTVGATGYVVGEASAKQVSRLTLTNGTLEPLKAHALIVVTNELLKIGGPIAQDVLVRELQTAAVRAVDEKFLSILLTGVTVGTSVGATALAARNDVAELLSQVTTDQTSRLFLVVTPLIAAMWSAMGATSTSGEAAFPLMTPQGGEIAGIRVLVSDALTAGQVVLVDATGIAAGSDALRLDVLRHGNVMLNDAPDSPTSASTAVENLWQHNKSALLVERWFGVEKLRTTAVAATSNANSYQSGFSPP